MKLLHIVPDHPKFLKDAIGMFDSIPGLENDCWVVRKRATPPQQLGIENAKGVSYEYFYDQCCKSASHDIIVIHNLLSIPFKYIAEIHSDIKVIWLSWGMDIYDYTFPEYPLIKLNNTIKTGRFKYHIYSLANYRYLKSVLSKYIRNRFKPRTIFNRAINRIDFYSGVFPQEWERLSQNKWFKAKQIQFNYSNAASQYTNETIYDDLEHERTAIQVGHSGYVFLNHLHTFNLLSKLDLGNLSVVAPLSYAPSGNRYTNEVIKNGIKTFGEKFSALTDFMPYQSYVDLMKSVRIAIFDIERQCGVGNCLIAIWNGAKVFFPESSINYQYFKSLDIKIYSIEHDLTSHELNAQLDRDSIIHNRKKLIEYWNHDNIRSRLSESLSKIVGI